MKLLLQRLRGKYRWVHSLWMGLLALGLFGFGLIMGKDWTPLAQHAVTRYTQALPVTVTLGQDVRFVVGWHPSLVFDSVSITSKGDTPLPPLRAHAMAVHFSWWEIFRSDRADARFSVERLDIILGAQTVPITNITANAGLKGQHLTLNGQYAWLDVAYTYTMTVDFFTTMVGFSVDMTLMEAANPEQTLSLQARVGMAANALALQFDHITTTKAKASGFMGVSLSQPHRVRSEWDVDYLGIGGDNFFGVADVLRILALFDGNSDGSVVVRAATGMVAGQALEDASFTARFSTRTPTRLIAEGQWQEQPFTASGNFMRLDGGAWRLQGFASDGAFGDLRGSIAFDANAATPLTLAFTSDTLHTDALLAAPLALYNGVHHRVRFPISFSLDVKKLSYSNTFVEPLRIALTMTDRAWVVERLAGRIHGMTFTTEGRLVTRGLVPTFALAITTESGTPLPWLYDTHLAREFTRSRIVLDGLATNLSLRANVFGENGQMAWHGFVKNILTTPTLDGKFALQHQQWWGGLMVESPMLASRSSLRLSALTGQLGGTPLRGQLQYQHTPATLNGALELGHLRLTDMLTVMPSASIQEAPRSGGLLDNRGCSTSLNTAWARQPISPKIWHDVAVDVRVNASSVDAFGVPLRNAVITLKNSADRLQLALSSVNSTMTLDAQPMQNSWQWRSEGRLANYALPSSSQGLSGGTLNTTWQLVSHGACLGQLVERLNGRAEYSLSNSRYESPRLASTLTILRQFGINPNMSIAQAQGTLSLQQGSLRIQDNTARLGFGTARVNGRIHLPTSQTDMTMRLTFDAFSDAPPLALRSTGTLDALDTRLGDTLFRDHMIRRGLTRGFGITP